MSLTCEGHGRCRREELEGELARFTRLQNEAGETLQGQLEEWERAERAEAELVALRAATAPVAYIWHSHIGLGAKSLRWSRPNQGEVAGEVTPLYFAAAAPAAPTNAAPQETPDATGTSSPEQGTPAVAAPAAPEEDV